MCLQVIYLIYMYEEELLLNWQEGLICHKTLSDPTTQTIIIVWINFVIRYKMK